MFELLICRILHSLERLFFVPVLMETRPNQPLPWLKRVLKYIFKNKSLLNSFCEHELLMSEIINNRKELKVRIPWELRSTFPDRKLLDQRENQKDNYNHRESNKEEHSSQLNLWDRVKAVPRREKIKTKTWHKLSSLFIKKVKEQRGFVFILRI